MKKEATNGRSLWQSLGPGILFAGAAIGGSHLIQSTRVGANYGFQLIGLVILVMLLKYPFFEFAHRYTIARQESLLMGYRRRSFWLLLGFLIMVLPMAIVNCGAVSFVCAALGKQFLGWDFSLNSYAAVIVSTVTLILLIGHYKALDLVMKLMMLLLAISTVTAVCLVLGKVEFAERVAQAPSVLNWEALPFLLAFMGWMPAPLDSSVWPSLWRLEREEETHHQSTLKEALVDFNVGYIGTAIMAICFIMLGAIIMCQTGAGFSDKATVFCGQLVDLYENALDGHFRWVISLVAFMTMLSTVMTTLDGYAKTIQRSFEILGNGREIPASELSIIKPKLTWVILPILSVATLLLVFFFTASLKQMIDFATIVAFLGAPAVAFINFQLISSKHTPDDFKPGRWLRGISWAGLTFLGIFCLLYLFK